MTEKETKKPVIRFNGYDDAWEQRKFTDIIERVNKSSSSDKLPKVEFEDIYAGEGRLNKDVTGKFDGRKGTEFEPKDILYGKLRPYLKNWLYPDFKGVALGDFWVFRANQSQSIFIYSLIQASKFQKVANDTSGTKMPRSDWKKVSDTIFSIPKIEEQTKIGNFFKQLDETITLQERELELLKGQRESFLQEMFPRQYENTPDIRFSFFSEPWKIKKFKDILKEFSIKSKLEDEYTVLSSTNNGMEIRDGRVSGSSNLGYKIVENEDLVLSPQNLWLGNINLNNIGIGLVSPSYKTFKILDINPKFVSVQLRQPRMLEEYKNASTQGASVVRRNLEMESFYQIPISIPCREEQDSIANFFTVIEYEITLQERKLEILKNIKKSFLQKMFV